jgi:hypothetical protein
MNFKKMFFIVLCLFFNHYVLARSQTLDVGCFPFVNVNGQILPLRHFDEMTNETPCLLFGDKYGNREFLTDRQTGQGYSVLLGDFLRWTFSAPAWNRILNRIAGRLPMVLPIARDMPIIDILPRIMDFPVYFSKSSDPLISGGVFLRQNVIDALALIAVNWHNARNKTRQIPIKNHEDFSGDFRKKASISAALLFLFELYNYFCRLGAFKEKGSTWLFTVQYKTFETMLGESTLQSLVGLSNSILILESENR